MPFIAASNASLVETESPVALKLSLELISKAPGVTDAQFFASDRVIDLYAWARAKNGALQRMFIFDGTRVTADEGKRAPSEPRHPTRRLRRHPPPAGRD